MEPEQTVMQPQQSQSSIELQRYKDGSYGYTMKKYQGSELPDLEEINLYDDELKRRFVAPAEGRGAP